MLTAQQRRSQILCQLQSSQSPISASRLATLFGVSRQIIVGDIALLRASGVEIVATPRGYRCGDPLAQSAGMVYTIACKHTAQQMAQELYTIVDFGATVLDVIVEHAVYGQLTGQLQLSSRYDVQQFLEKIAKSDAKPLSDLTGGIHLHTIRCQNAEMLQRILLTLRQEKILVEDVAEDS